MAFATINVAVTMHLGGGNFSARHVSREPPTGLSNIASDVAIVWNTTTVTSRSQLAKALERAIVDIAGSKDLNP